MFEQWAEGLNNISGILGTIFQEGLNAQNAIDLARESLALIPDSIDVAINVRVFGPTVRGVFDVFEEGAADFDAILSGNFSQIGDDVRDALDEWRRLFTQGDFSLFQPPDFSVISEPFRNRGFGERPLGDEERPPDQRNALPNPDVSVDGQPTSAAPVFMIEQTFNGQQQNAAEVRAEARRGIIEAFRDPTVRSQITPYLGRT